MTHAFVIRKAQEVDAQHIARLIQSVAHHFFVDPSGIGAEGFLSSISCAAVVGFLANPQFHYVVGLVDGELVGAAALRDNTHVYHLFVQPRFQRRGIAHQLWLHLQAAALSAGNHGTFTVNSSLLAIPVYAKFGFTPAAEQQTRNGIHYQPMQLLVAR
jgi:GNAT superfamily N-acetyltransferase